MTQSAAQPGLCATVLDRTIAWRCSVLCGTSSDMVAVGKCETQGSISGCFVPCSLCMWRRYSANVPLWQTAMSSGWQEGRGLTESQTDNHAI